MLGIIVGFFQPDFQAQATGVIKEVGTNIDSAEIYEKGKYAGLLVVASKVI